MRLLGKFDAFLPEIGRDCIDARDRKAEMVETLIGRDRRRIDAVTGIDLGQKDLGSAEPDVHAWLALLRRADHFGAEHALEPLRGGLRIGCAQVNMIPLIVWHWSSPFWLCEPRQGRMSSATALLHGHPRPDDNAERTIITGETT